MQDKHFKCLNIYGVRQQKKIEIDIFQHLLCSLFSYRFGHGEMENSVLGDHTYIPFDNICFPKQVY